MTDPAAEPQPPSSAGAGVDSAPDATPEPFATNEPEERLERRVVAYWYVADFVRAVVLTAMLVTAAEFWRAQEARHDWAPTVAWAFGFLLLILALVVPPLAYARWRFHVDDRLLSTRSGILFVEERRVPVPRMQHVDLVRGPIERLFALATLVVFTAGNEGSAFRVPGLSLQRAEALRDRILRARGQDVV